MGKKLKQAVPGEAVNVLNAAKWDIMRGVVELKTNAE